MKRTTSRAFGAQAAAWLARIPAQADLLVADATDAASALVEAVERKRQGIPFCASLLVAPRRPAVAATVAASVLSRITDYDERCAAFDKLASEDVTFEGQPVARLTALDPGALAGLRAFLDLSDGTVARSWTEAYAQRDTFGTRPTPVRLLTPLDAAVPLFARNRRASVVVWAPHAHVRDIAVIMLGLQEIHLPAFAICREGVLDRLRGTVADPSQARALLGEAAVIVDANVTDPGSALALARSGTPLVVASTSGAAEFLANVSEYDPWDRRSVATAVLAALANEAPSLIQSPCNGPIDLPVSSDRVGPTGGPRLSLIVRSFGDHAHLGRTLRSIALQTYDNVETLVVNDAGDSVDGIVASILPDARVVELTERGGPSVTAQAGLRAATGAYCALVDNDDIVFPDYAARLAHAIVRSPVVLLHCDAVTAIVESLADGSLTVRGYLAHIVNGVGYRDLLVHNAFFGSLRVAFSRSAALSRGGFHQGFPLIHDYEMWLGLGADASFAHVAHLGGMYTVRTDRRSASFSDPKAYARMHRDLHALYPAGALASVEAERERTYEWLEREGGWGIPQPLPRFNPALPFA